MKWLFFSIVVIVAGAVGALAIYAFALRGDDAARARSISTAVCAVGARPTCGDHLHHVGGDYWKFGDGAGGCYVVDVQRFNLKPVRGIQRARC